MKLVCPEGVGSINVAGVEYTATASVVEITDPVHIAAAKEHGFSEDVPTLTESVPAASDAAEPSTNGE